MSLFEQSMEHNSQAPLAERMRPLTLEEVVGQQHLLGAGKLLRQLIEQDQLIINDFTTINELSTFSRRGNSYEAESGCHDDMVMGLVLFSWLSDQTFFKDITDINTMMRLKQRTEEELMEDLLPFGFNMDELDDANEVPAYTGLSYSQF